MIISLLKKYCYQRKNLVAQKPSVPDLHIRRVESWKADYMDQIPDWSSSNRQYNLAQFSEIAEAQSEDAVRDTNFAPAIGRGSGFDANYYSSSVHSRLDNQYNSKDRAENNSNYEYIDESQKRKPKKRITHKLLKPGSMEKAHSFVKPILPPLNIDKIRDDKQNVLALQGFQDIFVSDLYGKSPIPSAVITKIKPMPGLDLSDAEGEASDEYHSEKREVQDPSGLQKIRMLVKKMVDQNTLKDLPELTLFLDEGNAPQSDRANNSSLIIEKRKPKKGSDGSLFTWACEIESKSLLFNKLKESKENLKDEEETKEYSSAKESLTNDKMRLCLVNLLLEYVWNFEWSLNQKVALYESDSDVEYKMEYINTLKTLFNTQCINNILYCHLSSTQIYNKTQETEIIKIHDIFSDYLNHLYSSDLTFIMDYDGTIHYAPSIQPFSTPFDNLQANRPVLFPAPLTPEKACLFSLLSKMALYNEFTLKVQVESTLKYLPWTQHSTSRYPSYPLALSRTQQDMNFGMEGEKTFINTTHKAIHDNELLDSPSFTASKRGALMREAANKTRTGDFDVGLFPKKKEQSSPARKFFGANHNLSSFDASAVLQIKTNDSRNSFWINGIAYSSEKINRELLRKKSDMFLVRISNSIWYKVGNISSDDILWWKEIDKDITLLSSYVKEVKSRVTIFQIIDTVIDPLLAIKRILIDVLLKDRKNTGLGSGALQSPFLNVESWRGSSHAQKSPNSYQRRDNAKSLRNDAAYQKEMLKLVASYLAVLSNIFLIWKTQEAFKLIWELFIKDKQWQETVESYTTKLFSNDLLTDAQKRMLRVEQPQTIININESILNFEDEEEVKDKNKGVNVKENIEIVQKNLTVIWSQLSTAIRYYYWINLFLQSALCDAKNKSKNSSKSSKSSGFGEVVEEVEQEFEEDDDEEDKEHFSNVPRTTANNWGEEKNWAQQKLLRYWIKVQKSVLFNYAFLIAPQRGYLLEYLNLNSTTFRSSHPPFTVPKKYTLTLTTLLYIESLFSSCEKSLYPRIFTDELTLLFLILHFTSFWKLYKHHLSKSSSILWNAQINESTNMSAIMKYQQYLNLTDVNQAALELCKLHLKWVWVLVNNRSAVIRKNIYQLKILPFLVNEIQLEYQDSQRQAAMGKA